ncbi:hypothetical protein Ahia01_001000600, partial [Argonauta hians]
MDEDFETFVKEFPIDDNISECFASSSDDTVHNSDSTISGDDSHTQKDQKSRLKQDKVTSRSRVAEVILPNGKQKQRIGNGLFRKK